MKPRPAPAAPPATSPRAASPSRQEAAGSVLSRLAGASAWLARYLERAENTARLAAAAQHLSLSIDPTDGEAPWALALRVGLPAIDPATVGGPAAAAALLLVDRAQPSSVVGSLQWVRENARAARHLLTSDLWEAINQAYIESRGWDADGISGRGLDDFLGWTRRQCQWIRGAALDVPQRSLRELLAWGQAVERIDCQARLLTASLPALDGIPEPAPGSGPHRRWQALLAASASGEAYRRRAGGRLRADEALALLVGDEESPRSLAGCAARALDSLCGFAGEAVGPAQAAAARVAEVVAGISPATLPGDTSPLAELLAANNTAAEAVETFHFASGPAAA